MVSVTIKISKNANRNVVVFHTVTYPLPPALLLEGFENPLVARATPSSSSPPLRDSRTTMVAQDFGYRKMDILYAVCFFRIIECRNTIVVVCKPLFFEKGAVILALNYFVILPVYDNNIGCHVHRLHQDPSQHFLIWCRRSYCLQRFLLTVCAKLFAC
jgi:hypothetical protein